MRVFHTTRYTARHFRGECGHGECFKSLQPQSSHRLLNRNANISESFVTSNLIQFQFVMPGILKDFFMFTASNKQRVMNMQIFR